MLTYVQFMLLNLYTLCVGWRHKSSKEKLQITILMVLGTPFWLMALLILPPVNSIDRYLKIPLLKFVANLVMYLSFIFIATWNQIKLLPPAPEDLDTDSFRHGSHIKWYEYYIFLWMLGSMFQEIREMSTQGVKAYLNDVWNFLDFMIAVMFLIATTARMNDALEVFEYKSIERTKWEFYDNLLIYEASLCMGTLVAVNRILHFFRASRLLGKLQMSLGSSFGEIAKFMALFLIMYISFASAINALYWKDQYTVINACDTRDALNTTTPYTKCPDLIWNRVKKGEFQFTTLGGCLYQLYWTLFGYSDIVFASKVYANWTLHTFVGSILFILFNFVAVVVLLNVLIGMITKTLDNIEENIDTEWKFARSNIYAEYISDSDCLPAPFNIFPSLRKILLGLAKLWHACYKSEKLLFYAKPGLKDVKRRRQESEDRLPDIIRAMKDQYMRNQMKEAEAGEVTLDDLDSLKNDVSGLKFEVLSYVRCVPTTLDAMCKRQFQQLHEIDFLQRKQKEQWDEMLAHEFRMQEMRKEHNEELVELRRRQDEAFAETRLHTSTKMEEATKFQTRQAHENQVEAKEKISQAKTEQINRVNDIYCRQDEHFRSLREEQDSIKSVQKENAAAALTNTLMLKDLIDQQDKKTTQFKLEQDSKMKQMEQKQVEMVEKLRSESDAKHNFQLENMRELHNLQQESLKSLHTEQISTMKSIETEYRNRLNTEMFSLKQFYESKMGEYLLTQQSIISDQSKLIRELLSGIEEHFTMVSHSNSQKILESQKMIPTLFRNETKIVCQSMQDLYHSKPMSLPATPMLPRERTLPSRLPKPSFRTPVPINQVRATSSQFEARSITGLSNYSSTSSLNSIGETSVDTGVSSSMGNFNHVPPTLPNSNANPANTSYSSVVNSTPKPTTTSLPNSAPPAANVMKSSSHSFGATSWLPRFNKVKSNSDKPNSKKNSAPTQQNGL